MDADPSAGEVALGADAAGVADEIRPLSHEGRVAAVRADVGVPAQSALGSALLRRGQEDEVVGCCAPGEPAGSKRVKTKASTKSSRGTPYWRPIEIETAKLFISERKAAPSLCMSMKISPSSPSSYSPVWR
jgi:hypothetical protein